GRVVRGEVVAVVAGAAGRSHRRARPSVHRAAATRRSWARPDRDATLAETARKRWPARVSSTKPGRLPGPTCTNARTPLAWRRRVSGPKRTGSSRWRITRSRTAAGSSGKGATVVADHTGTDGRWIGRRSNESRTGPR